MNIIDYLIVFVAVEFCGLIFAKYMSMQEKVAKKFPGFLPCVNPLATIPLFALNLMVNWTCNSRKYRHLSYIPNAKWFSNVIDIQCTDDASSTIFGFSREQSVSIKEYADRIHPILLGYDWYRCYYLQFNDSEVLIFTPWVYPQDTRTCLFLYKGKIPMLKIVWTFIVGVLNKIEVTVQA